MKKKAVFPGSFDPITLGHCDIIERGLQLFDEIVLAIGVNSAKQYTFGLEERKRFLEETFAEESRISIATYNTLTVDFCKSVEAQFILRGLRSTKDFNYEQPIAQTNRVMAGDVETVFLMASPEVTHISSSIVREIMKYNGNYQNLVPYTVRK
ncbi:pantetheine-phosphate adenylyltransferase [Gilvibacter sp. SZ-19]|uniref:pantetheine-phosphate adenylyltransferase n=1 Tax=Gilvibacter sp. SZ-19 TaxID=754429 RepID=UPI000B3CB9D9|nr:pantetheine-phosphate adenylyltransferase [Gilvibacter sp. SZ-19]ARV11280.1 pantetheine-phosphate adenylyltransferase [Gilvibacter sp. SZ-19]